MNRRPIRILTPPTSLSRREQPDSAKHTAHGRPDHVEARRRASEIHGKIPQTTPHCTGISHVTHSGAKCAGNRRARKRTRKSRNNLGRKCVRRRVLEITQTYIHIHIHTYVPPVVASVVFTFTHTGRVQLYVGFLKRKYCEVKLSACMCLISGVLYCCGAVHVTHIHIHTVCVFILEVMEVKSVVIWSP